MTIHRVMDVDEAPEAAGSAGGEGEECKSQDGALSFVRPVKELPAGLEARSLEVRCGVGGPEPFTANLSEVVAAARAAEMIWGYGDFTLRIAAVPRSDAAAAELLAAEEVSAGEEDEVADASVFIGQTPASVIEELTNDVSIFGCDEHPLMTALEKQHGSFVAALLPHANEPIVEAAWRYYYDGNDCQARFATRAYAFSFYYETS